MQKRELSVEKNRIENKCLMTKISARKVGSRDVRWSKFVGTGKERNAFFQFLSRSRFFRSFPRTSLESIRSHFGVNEREQLQNSQELGSKAAIAQPDWRRPYSLPERPEDEEWAPGTVVRWRDESKAPTWGFCFGLVAHEWPGDLKEEVDRESWQQGKISIFTGWELVWADPKDLIWLPLDASVPLVLSHGLASPSSEKPSQEPPGSRLEWVSNQGLLDAECLELPIKQPSIPHLIRK